MAAARGTTRVQIGSALWVAEERSSALQLVEAEAEEFTFSARNELDWLNEHMAEIFNENQLSVTEMFKTPGKLRGKTPRTVRKRNPLEPRQPLSDIFSTTPRAAGSPLRQVHQERQTPRFKVAEDVVEPPKQAEQSHQSQPAPNWSLHTMSFDSGYYGSQATQATQISIGNKVIEDTQPHSTQKSSPLKTPAKFKVPEPVDHQSDERRTTEGSYQSAKEEQTMQIVAEKTTVVNQMVASINKASHLLESPKQSRIARPPSPQKRSPERPMPSAIQEEIIPVEKPQHVETDVFEDVQSPPSDGSSPVRQLVRKSSLSFAALPAREPLTTKKSIGNRTSRTSHLDQSRTSYYGKSLGGQMNDDEDEMDVDDEFEPKTQQASQMTQAHNKSYTQRLQDQISMLGQSKPNAPRPSKSIPNIAAFASQSQSQSQTQAAYPILPRESRPITSPSRTERSIVAPGAFPEDEDSWIGPPTVSAPAPSIFSPRSTLAKSYSAEVMGKILGKDSISGAEFNVPEQRRDEPRARSPVRELPVMGRTAGIFGHVKSSSVSAVISPMKDRNNYEMAKKTISVSNPEPAIPEEQPASPPKSPSRSYRDSPLKAAKDKLSSILKTSKGLFASSAAASAGALASTLSPPPARFGQHAAPSLEDVLESQSMNNASLYPSLKTQSSNQSLAQPESPSKKASTRKQKEKEARDAQLMLQQLNKLDKEREKESEKARAFQQQEKESEKARAFQQQEKERVVAMERKILAQQEEERRAGLAKQAAEPRATRSSPRKTKAQLEAEGRAVAAASAESNEDVEMSDAAAMPPPSLSRSIASQIGRPKSELKRPMRPAKEPISKAKQPPTVIRVNTGSRPFQPSNATLAANLQDSLPAPAPKTGPSTASKGKQPAKSFHPKPSTESLRSVASSTTTKVKALEAAARKREQDEREEQRKREAKLELANHLDAKKNAQKALEKKQAIERAKLERPPPPAARPNPTADNTRDKPLPERPDTSQGHRMNTTAHRPQEDVARTANTLSNTTKAPPKRPLPNDEAQSRPTIPRNGPSYQQNDSKRRKTEDEHDEDMMESQPRGAMAPPIRQSAIRQKDMPMKSLFPSGYATASGPSHGSMHKGPHAIPQHMQHGKAGHPLDMAQTSKAPINFAPNPAHKTPARPAGPMNPSGKSTSKPSAKASPRYQNGDSIDLPEIHTDSEEDSDDGGDFAVPDWANSPNLAAGIMAQESLDPASVFGPPGELKMEEVFRNKERWGRFRQRTSSANWSGSDRLTEEEVQRDLVARERLRREGGWSYGLS